MKERREPADTQDASLVEKPATFSRSTRQGPCGPSSNSEEPHTTNSSGDRRKSITILCGAAVHPAICSEHPQNGVESHAAWTSRFSMRENKKTQHNIDIKAGSLPSRGFLSVSPVTMSRSPQTTYKQEFSVHNSNVLRRVKRSPDLELARGLERWHPWERPVHGKPPFPCVQHGLLVHAPGGCGRREQHLLQGWQLQRVRAA